MSAATRKAASKKGSNTQYKKNIKNSLVNNINVKKKKNSSKSKKKSTVSKKAFSDMENNCGKKE